jgi:hypothetical protein
MFLMVCAFHFVQLEGPRADMLYRGRESVLFTFLLLSSNDIFCKWIVSYVAKPLTCAVISQIYACVTSDPSLAAHQFIFCNVWHVDKPRMMYVELGLWLVVGIYENYELCWFDMQYNLKLSCC